MEANDVVDELVVESIHASVVLTDNMLFVRNDEDGALTGDSVLMEEKCSRSKRC